MVVKKRRQTAAGKAGAKRKKGANAAEAEAVAGGVSSDEVSSQSEHEEAPGGDEDDAFFETPEEKRVRVAKEYISRVGEGRAPEEVQEQLTRDVEEQQRRARVQISDLQLGEPRFLKGHKEVPTCVCLSSDDRTAVSGGKDCALLRWDVETGKKDVLHPGGKGKFDCGGHFSFVLGVCMVEQRSLLLSTGYDRLVRLWDARASPRTACVAKLQGHMACATGIVADPNGEVAYSIGLDKSLRVWDLAARRLKDTLFGHVSGVTSIDIFNNARPLTGGVDKTARLWKLDRDTHLMFSRHTYPVDAVAVMDHESFASGAQDGTVHLWSMASKKPVASTSLGKGVWITALGSIRRGNVVFGGSTTGRLHTLQVGRGAENGKSTLNFLEAVPAVQLPGAINAIAVGRKVLVCAVGKEHRLGRWFCDNTQKNGLTFAPLSYREEGESKPAGQ